MSMNSQIHLPMSLDLCYLKSLTFCFETTYLDYCNEAIHYFKLGTKFSIQS